MHGYLTTCHFYHQRAFISFDGKKSIHYHPTLESFPKLIGHPLMTSICTPCTPNASHPTPNSRVASLGWGGVPDNRSPSRGRCDRRPLLRTGEPSCLTDLCQRSESHFLCVMSLDGFVDLIKGVSGWARLHQIG